MLALYGKDNTTEYKRFEKVTSVCEFILYTIAQTYVQKQDWHKALEKVTRASLCKQGEVPVDALFNK